MIGALSVGLFSCSDDQATTARFEVRLTDSPGDYDEVNVDIQGIEYHVSEGAQTGGWQNLEVPSSGVYNLLDFTNGVDTLIGQANLEPGKISQIRLILGDNNTVVVDGESHELKTPSAQQSGLKLQINETLLAGITYSILLDFDAAKSVVKAGTSGNYNLKPVIRTITEATSGALKGTIFCDTLNLGPVAVFAIIGEDSVGTYTDENKAFSIGALPEGTYDVSFDVEGDTLDQVVNGIIITNGEVTDMGETVIWEQ